MTHDIPAKSKLLPAIPITSRQFVYRKAGETDVRLTFARARAGLEAAQPPAPKPVIRPQRIRPDLLTPPRVASRPGR